jgi:hypothetical protein
MIPFVETEPLRRCGCRHRRQRQRARARAPGHPFVYGLGLRFERYDPRSVLDLPRAGGLRATAMDAQVYGALIPPMQETSSGSPVYAGPDFPKIQFLSGLKDVVPRGDDSSGNPMQRPEEVFRCLDEESGRAVVLNRGPLFADQLQPRIVGRFEELFPPSRAIGQFVARWRD